MKNPKVSLRAFNIQLESLMKDTNFDSIIVHNGSSALYTNHLTTDHYGLVFL